MRDDLVFVDCETTGLVLGRHVPWEIALIIGDRKYHWLLRLTDEELANADPFALDVGGFHERHPQGNRFDGSTVKLGGIMDAEDPRTVAGALGQLTHGKHLVGCMVWFDAERFQALMENNGVVPGWHYHLIDVESLALGYLRGYDAGRDDGMPSDWFMPSLPWKSSDLWKALGVDTEGFAKHTAMGDAALAQAVYRKVVTDAVD